MSELKSPHKQTFKFAYRGIPYRIVENVEERLD